MVNIFKETGFTGSWTCRAESITRALADVACGGEGHAEVGRVRGPLGGRGPQLLEGGHRRGHRRTSRKHPNGQRCCLALKSSLALKYALNQMYRRELLDHIFLPFSKPAEPMVKKLLTEYYSLALKGDFPKRTAYFWTFFKKGEGVLPQTKSCAIVF